MAWIETDSGVVIPAPELGSGGVSISTMVDGARSNASGLFVGSTIGDDKLSIDCSFGEMSPEDFQQMLKIFDRKQGGRFINTFRVFDPRVNDFVYMKMYVGDRSGTPYAVSPETFFPHLWRDCKMKLVEV